MRILLLSAYDCLSHRYWRENLVKQFPEFDWTVLALPARHFSFRVRSNPVSWWLAEAHTLKQPFDLVIATSLVDIATLRGLFANLAAVPLWLYCHENQFAYPASPQLNSIKQPRPLLEAQMVFLYGCMCAEHISFNSQWNRSSALHGLAQLIRRFPEKWGAGLLQSIEKKSSVLAVPLLPAQAASSRGYGEQGEWQLLWNHRWEYDKGPQHLLAFAQALQHSGLACTLHVVGQQFRQQPDSFARLSQLFASGARTTGLRKGHWGFVESSAEYQALLASCDVVLSTAVHDFQGLAVLEAVQAGCLPLLPNQVVYPEQFAPDYLYQWHAEPDSNARAMLDKLLQWQAHGRPALPSVAHFGWPVLRRDYRAIMASLACQ